jgi:hypothetical protein
LHRHVRVADERRGAIDRGVQSRDLQFLTLQGTQRFDGTDATHRGFSAIDDC